MRYPFYSLPPAGNKIPLKIILRAIKASRQGDNDSILDPLKSYLGTQNLLFLSSGRTALWLILKTLANLRPDRTEVIVPAYTCPAVASAVLKAGLNPVLCDINLNDFSFLKEELEKKINQDTLAVVVVHLFGFPCDIKELKDCCTLNKTFIVEDAAQAFGNSNLNSPEEKLGLLGDAGFYSFGRGKPLSFLHGGLAVFKSSRFFNEAKLIYDGLVKFEGLKNVEYSVSLLGYLFLSNPYLYWIPQRMPFLHLGETRFEPEFDLLQGSSITIALVSSLLATLNKEKETRYRNSEWYIKNTNKQTLDFCLRYDRFPYLRFPLLFPDRQTRNQMFNKMQSKGCGAALYYPTTLNQMPGLKEKLKDSENYENGNILANRLLTLPVHSGVRDSDLKRIAFILENAN